MKISLCPSESCTSITESSFSMPIVMMPPARGFAHADSPRVGKCRYMGFLDGAFARAHHNEAPGGNLLHGKHRRELFAALELHQVGNRLALAVGADVRDLVHLQPIRAAAIREDHH